MNPVIQGRVVRLAYDDVNTDIIAPGEFRLAVEDNDHELTALRPHVFRAIRPGLNNEVKPGDIFVVGKNFGCGSHREPAVQIFKVWGVQAVVTDTAARIWFRNAIAAGLPVFELPNATHLFDESDEIQIDLETWTVTNLAKNTAAFPISPFPNTVMRILDAGGIMPLLKQRVDAEIRHA